jgi:hypothetical protein
MVRNAGFEVLGFKVFSDIRALVLTLNNTLKGKGKKPIPFPLFAPFSPLYKLFGILTRKGELMTIWARRN